MVRRRGVVVLLAVVGLVSGGIVPAGAVQPGTATVKNTELAQNPANVEFTAVTDSGVVAFGVTESSQGGADLNGDTDIGDDFVVHLFDPATGKATNTGLTHDFRGIVAAGNRVAFAVSEADQGGTDLNGDTDTADSVVHIFDPATGTATNTRLANGGDLVAAGNRVAFWVSEFSQGGTNLNGDGADGDQVLHVFDPATGTSANVGLTGDSFGDLVAVGDRVAFGVSEFHQGETDLNGDSDFGDDVLQVFDPSTGTVTNTRLAKGSGLTAVGNRVAFGVPEGFQDLTDLNRDGDTFDKVAHLFDPATAAASNTGLAYGGALAAVGPRVAMGVSELAQGSTVLNGDGDTADFVLHVFDPAKGTSANTGLDAGSMPLVGVGNRVAWAVGEAAQGATDLNGDGDTTDSVVHVFDPATATAANTRVARGLLSGFNVVAVGERVALDVWEGDAGDLNGDGDVADLVVQVFDPATGTFSSSGLASPSRGLLVAVGNRVAFSVPESAQGRTDLNGDGDVGDEVVHAFDAVTSSVFNLRLAKGDYGLGGGGNTRGAFVAGGDVAAFSVSELGQSVDLNGDGDKNDNVKHVVTSFMVSPATIGLVDTSQGTWHMRNGAGVVTTFGYGNPGDLPVSGDWDGNGTATPGLYRQSDGFFYARNSNSTGIANAECFAGDPSDVPLAGDWDGDGDDNLGIYRPSEQKFYLFTITCTGSSMGAAQIVMAFGNPGDKPVSGDWDGDGIDEIGLHRESTGFFYWRNTLDTGIASGEIFFGDPNDRFVSGDWGIVDGVDTPAVFRPGDVTYYFRHTLTQGIADSQLTWTGAGSEWLPVAGAFGLG